MQNYYLIGDPVSHSLSPAMHNTAFSLLGIDAHYGLVTAGVPELKDAVSRLLAEGASGWNCTMPVKSAMCGLCDELSLESRIGGSVNTVKNVGGKLLGDTTDGRGFLDAAKEAGFAVENASLVLLGTGGAASAILIASALAGAAHISVFYNRPESGKKAEALAEKLSPHSSCEIEILPLADQALLKEKIGSCGLLINASSVGMKKGGAEDAGCLVPDISFLASRPDVMDIIYNPRKTPLLSMAESAGCRTENGLPMLLLQGAASFRIWTGRTMPVPEIRRLVFDEPLR